jgi:hypothetical protein
MDVSEFDLQPFSLSKSRFVFDKTIVYPILSIFEKEKVFHKTIKIYFYYELLITNDFIFLIC